MSKGDPAPGGAVPGPERGAVETGQTNRVARLGMPERRSGGGAVAEAADGRSVTEVAGFHPILSVGEHSHACTTPPTQTERRAPARSTPGPNTHNSAQRGRRHRRWRWSQPSTATCAVWVSGTPHGVWCAEFPESRAWFCGFVCVSGRGGLRVGVVGCCQCLGPHRPRFVNVIRAPQLQSPACLRRNAALGMGACLRFSAGFDTLLSRCACVLLQGHIRFVSVAVCLPPHAASTSHRVGAMCAGCALPRSSWFALFRPGPSFVNLGVCAACRTIGRGTNCSVMRTTLILPPMRSSFGSQNWVSALSVLNCCSTCVLCTLHVLARCGLFLMRSCLGFNGHRPACVAPSPSMPFSLSPFGPHHLHADPPSGGDVLQLGAPGGLQQPSGSPGAVRGCLGARVSRPRTILVVHGARR